MDNFRKYIQENADQLDCEEPNERTLDVLRIINKNKRNTFQKLLHNHYARTACAFGILGLIAVLLIRFDKEKLNQTENNLVPKIQNEEPYYSAKPLLSKKTKKRAGQSTEHTSNIQT